MTARRRKVLRIVGIVFAVLVIMAIGGYFEIKRRINIPTPIVAPPNPDQDLGPQVEAAVTRGLSWLAGLQRKDGSWSNPSFPSLTALPLLAFTRSNFPEKADICERAATFVAGFSQEDGGIYQPKTAGRTSGGLSVYNTAVSILALFHYDRERFAPIILKARDFIASSQLVGGSGGPGGFSYQAIQPKKEGIRGLLQREQRADMNNTAWAMRAMRETQEIEDLRGEAEVTTVDWDAALKYVKELQNTDPDSKDVGGFGYTRSGERGGVDASGEDKPVALRAFGSMTYAGLQAMIYAQVDRRDPRVESAIKWASRYWTVEQNPGAGTVGLFYYYNIMSKSLSLLGPDRLSGEDGEQINWRKDLLTRLISVQREDGSWVNANGAVWEGDAVLVTSYSLLSLLYATGATP